MAEAIVEVVNSVTFQLPSLPGSVNELYEFNRHDSGLPRKRLKGEWALWASRMFPHIPQFTVRENSLVRIDRCYYYPWFYKNGKWRKADVSNMDALLFNTIARKIGIDDLWFKQGMMNSRDSEARKVIVTLTEISESEWRAWHEEAN